MPPIVKPYAQHSIVVLVNENTLLKHQISDLHGEINRLKSLIETMESIDLSCNPIAPIIDVSNNILARTPPVQHIYTQSNEPPAPQLLPPRKQRKLIPPPFMPVNPNPENGTQHSESERCFRYRPYYPWPNPYPWWYDDDGYYSG